MKVLQLLPIGNLDGGLLMELGPALGDAFHIPCKMMPRPLDPEIAFHRERQQYHSSELLCQMQGYVREDCWRLLGITACDPRIGALRAIELQPGQIVSYPLTVRFIG